MKKPKRWSLLILTVIIGGCDVQGPSTNRTFDDYFLEVARIGLQEDADDPLSEIASLTPSADSGFIVVDGNSDRVWVYDATGRIRRSVGGSGDGPGELRQPTAAVEGPEGELHVVERGSPRHSVFWTPDSISISQLPGLYGFWLQPVTDGLIVGVGSREARFAVMSLSGELHTRFGARRLPVEQTPYWVYFIRERAAVLGDRIFINESFAPTVRVFSTSGDSLSSFGVPPTNWIAPTNPGIATISSPTDRARLEEWARSFTVVSGLAATQDVVILQYGHHDPAPNDPYRVVPRSADVYSKAGERIVQDLPMDSRILAGGRRVYLLESEPPEPWTISVREWAGR